MIACTWAFPLARRRPVHLAEAAETCLWPGWMLAMEKWLAEASFLLRLLMAPNSCPKGSGKHLPGVQNHPLGEAVIA